MPSCLIIAGEKSGEEHAMTFFPELKRLCPDTKFFGVGGDELAGEGVEILYHLKDFSSMGFSEVIKKIPFYFSSLKTLEAEVLKRGTKTAILVDFQDFNLRLALKLSKHGVKVLYYVAPQAWAWKAGRASKLATATNTLFTILPFEKEWFTSRGVAQVKSIPHPLMKTYQHELSSIPRKPFGSWNEKLKILLLPGSRRLEVSSLLPEFIQAVRELKKSFNVEVHLVKVSHLDSRLYSQFNNDIDVFWKSEDLVPAMKEAHVALAASGTVTLSTGLFELPTVVAYRVSLLNEFVFNNFIKYQGDISLTNIIHGKRLFPELKQAEANAPAMVRAIKAWFQNESAYNEIKQSLRETKNLLAGESFSVPAHMAQVINEK